MNDDLITFPQHPDSRAIMRLLGFWKGTLTTRQAVMAQASDDYERSIHAAAIGRIETIMDGVEAGAVLEDMPEFHRWLADPRAV